MTNQDTVAFWLHRKAWAEGYIIKYSNKKAQAKLDIQEVTDPIQKGLIQLEIDRYIQLLGEGHMESVLELAIKNLTRLGQERLDEQ